MRIKPNALYQRRSRARQANDPCTPPVSPATTRIELAWEQERAGMVFRVPPSPTSPLERQKDADDEARFRKEFKP